MCGDCHTTDFSKAFSSQELRWNSRFSELGNGCESCHGAGSKHVQNQQPLLGLHDQAAQLDQCGVCHARRLGVLELARATQRAPTNSHYAYVYAVGLRSTQTGGPSAWIATLSRAPALRSC